MKQLIFSFLALFALVVFTPASISAQTMEKSDKNIAQLAMETPQLSTLVTAVKAAGLADALMADGEMTVFAPTNDAFANLPEGTLNALLMPKNKEVLKDILMYHTSNSSYPAATISAGIEDSEEGMITARTMNGDFSVMMQNDKVAIKDGKMQVATVTTADIMASNGTIHLIDKVLLPKNLDVAALLKNSAVGMKDNAMDKADKMANNMKDDMKSDYKAAKADVKEMKSDMTRESTMQRTTRTMSTSNRANNVGPTIADVAMDNENFTTLVTAVKAADLAETLSGSGEFTVFAPTDDAFDKLPAGTVGELTKSSNKAKLQGILQFHVIPARISAAQLTKAIAANKGYYRLQTIDGQSLYATMKNGDVMLTDGNGNMAKVTMTDVDSSNGVIHAIDGVLMPREKMTMMDDKM